MISAMTVDQGNETCAPCHAMMSPVPGYLPSQRFFDHYDLVTLESEDRYPDGRDLAENYTYSRWLMSPCVRNGQFDCIHCHTSSGRYKFATENPNGACLPCHREQVSDLESHSHHKASGEAGKCITCHMAKTRFANMNRSDHSMLPPAPAATLLSKSPNACNLCHRNRSAAWADQYVRRWHEDDYRKSVIERGEYIEVARGQD